MKIYRFSFLLAIASVAAFAQVSGFVTNKSANQPAPGAVVTLVRMAETGETTDIAKSTADAQGKFSFTEQLSGIYALNTEFKGVTYSQIIPPMLPKDNLQVSVYDITPNRADLSVEQHIYFLEPGASQLVVSETFVVGNRGQRTFQNDREGAVRFYLPPEAKGIVQTSVVGPDEHPIRAVAEKTSDPTIYQVNQAIVPGESRIDINYIIPYEGGAGTFTTVNSFPNAKTRIVVAAGVAVEGDGLESLGAEPRTQAQIFGHSGANVSVKLSGTGAISDPGTSSGGEGESPQIESTLPPIYDRMTMIAIAGGLAMLFAFIFLYRRSPGAEAAVPTGGKRAE